MTLGLVLVVSVLFLGLLYVLWKRALSDLRTARSNSQSLSTKYGQMTEQFIDDRLITASHADRTSARGPTCLWGTFGK